MNEVSKAIPENTTIVGGNGCGCVVTGSALLLKKGQRFIINSACASMGYDLPAAIGACFSKGKKTIYCITGDGSIQMNLQELQTIVFHKLPIKILLINNQGYHSMRQTERNLFPNLSKIGVGPETGDLSFPELKKIMQAYGIPYCCAHTNDEIPSVLADFVKQDGYGMMEVFVDTEQNFEPKPTAKQLSDGSMVSPPLEDLAPFMDREELRKIMLIPLVGE